jgi:uncharacterized repeat protein (TIGR02543 family)
MVVMVMVAVTFASLLVVSAAQAMISQGDTTVRAGNTFYAYVNAGERMQVIWNGLNTATAVNEKGASVPIASDGYTPTAGTSGVWRVTLPKESGLADGYTYDMSVRSGTTEKRGRIWVYEDKIFQHWVNSGYQDLNYFGVSDLGYIYQIKMNQFNGIDSVIALRSSGAAPDNGCDVEDRSFETGYVECGDKYRLFFEDPRSSGLPATANMAGSTIPVLPPLVTSTQLTTDTTVAFTPTTDKVGGSFVVSSNQGFSGTAELQIDANNNGSYGDTVDVKKTLVVNGGTSAPWAWNGKDASGADARAGGKARAIISGAGEAHLLLVDVETFAGLTMTRLNGASAPDSTIRWDDSQLTEARGGTPPPVKICLSGCNSNVTNGLHGWTRGTAATSDPDSTSWGDGRIIDNWAYVSMNATSPAITLPALRTLTFDANGGSISGVTSITRTNGNAWGTLPTASQANQDFVGWFTAKTGGTQVTASTAATSSFTAYAQWTPTPRTLTFDANGGAISGATSITKPNGTAWGTLSTATRANYDFLGWYTAKTGGTAVTSSTVATSDITVYAQWTPTLRTLTFNANGGAISGVTSITKPNGTAWGTLSTANMAGKVFLGWYTATTAGTQVTASTVATSSFTTYAQWRAARFNVVFYGNAQMGTVTGATGSILVDSGCTTCLLPASGFTKTTGAPALIDHETETAEVNSAFLGWSLDPLSHTGDIADRAVAGNLSQTDGATVKLYAIWDDAPRFIIKSYPDRFFTLKQAKAGSITEAELLRTVQATDKETNPLVNKTKALVLSSGSDVGVTLFDYDASDFTSLTDSGVVTATYKVKDGAGNVAFLRIRITVSDDAPLAQDSATYLRGISPDYAAKGSGDGGLTADSLWKTDPTRKASLDRALSGTSATRYCLGADAITDLRALLRDPATGLGNSKTPDGLATSAGILRTTGTCP